MLYSDRMRSYSLLNQGKKVIFVFHFFCRIRPRYVQLATNLLFELHVRLFTECMSTLRDR